ncbi:MAG: signal peptide peptidase SppA [SAR324 cluster bacterium]|uniref:Signal peptide peptidase SppA n=1 Tax=SAR324 cluster bacterium TaxID=2024889 RepID=A0A2A4T0Q2_9DELT|nr:MAG: signal peptide peptidase SppA [SAR324 cluster bacterium]
MTKIKGFFLLIGLLTLNGCFFSIPDPNQLNPLSETELGGQGPHKILVMEISGIISQEGQEARFGEAPKVGMVARIKEELLRAEMDSSIKAILLLINSPGGEVTASDLIYHELNRFRKKTKIPIISNIVSIGASGGYYIAMASDRVMAHPTAITGSIGVIISSVNVFKLMEKIGVQDSTYKSGVFKDMGSPLKPPNSQERQLFDNLVQQLYQQFVSIVVDSRKLSREEVLKLADGRVYLAAEAKKSGLIDEIGYMEDSIKLAQSLAGISSARLVTYHRPQEFKNNIYNRTYFSADRLNLFNLSIRRLSGPKFLYLWNPSL